MKVIVFSGLDGAGKSTQIDNLQRMFVSQNKKCYVFWSRGGYTPGFQFLKNLLRFIFRNRLPKPGFSTERKKALSNNLIRRLWLTIAIIDLIYFYSFYLRLKLFFGFTIICDRYLIDTLIDFNIAYPNEKVENWMLWKLLNYTSLKPDFHFICTIPVKESIIRSKIKFEPFPDSPEVLKKRLIFYNNELKKDKSLFFIDGMIDKNIIKENIYDIIGNN